MQTGISTERLQEGFSYELEVTARCQTVEYYCGELRCFLQWVDKAGITSDIRLITKHHIQIFFHSLLPTAATDQGTTQSGLSASAGPSTAYLRQLGFMRPYQIQIHKLML